MKFSKIKHPLIREGKGQDKRYLKSLSTDHVKVDERQLEDLLEFVYRFSKEVSYYDKNLSKDAWTEFFVKSAPFQIAFISKFNLDGFREDYFKVSNNPTQKFDQLKVSILLNKVFQLAYQVNIWYLNLDEDKSGFRVLIKNIISTNFKHALVELIGYSNTYAKDQNSLLNNNFDAFFNNQAWELDFADQFTAAHVPGKISLTEEYPEELHKKIDNLFLLFWKGVSEVTQQAPLFLEKSIVSSSQKNHEPHIALLFAFVRLFNHVQDDLNRFTARHLNFFYRDVLRLLELDYIPDKAHLTFGLAKNSNELLLPPKTLFKAGKDSKGEEIQFMLEDEIIVNKAKIEAVKTLFVDQNFSKNQPNDPALVKGLSMAPMANSADGMGEDFTDQTPPSWPTLGSKFSKFVKEDLNGKQEVQPYSNPIVGLLVGSPVLYLPEGKRTIHVTITFKFSSKSNSFIGNEEIAILKEKVATNLLFSEAVRNNIEAEDISLEAKDYIRAKKDNELVKIGSKVDNLHDFIFSDAENSNLELAENDIKVILQYVEKLQGFQANLSGEKDWLVPNNLVVRISDFEEKGIIDPSKFNLNFHINLPEDFDPILFYDSGNLGVDYGTSDPLLKIELDHTIKMGNGISLYHYLRFAEIETTNINVDVSGVRDLIVQNDDGLQSADKKFLPFGAIPKIGSKFYIGSKEVFQKNFTSASLKIDWEGLPSLGMGEHYAIYNASSAPIQFEAKARVLVGKEWKESTENSKIDDIFSKDIPVEESTFIEIKNDKEIDQKYTINKDKDLDFFGQTTVDGFVHLELINSDFKHREYSKVFSTQFQAQAALDSKEEIKIYTEATYKVLKDLVCEDDKGEKLTYIKHPHDCWDINNAGNFEAPLPNEPYTPTINGFSLNYQAKASLSNVNFTHLYPFEGTYNPLSPLLFLEQKEGVDELGVETSKPSLLPQHNFEGELYIGLVDLVPGNNLNLYFKVAESTADPEVERAKVLWGYLSNNEWKPLLDDVSVLKDETKGLIASGIVQLAIPRDITHENTKMPSGLCWVKASVNRYSKAISETILVTTQGARVIFVPNDKNDLSRLSEKLPTGSISKLAQENAQLKSITQPFDSFGGRAPEKSQRFDLRISERLRHKGRGITIFDYERIVLQNFPEVNKVKCITHTMGRKGQPNDFEVAPGFVTIAVIPDLKLVEGANKYKPQLYLDKLEIIKAYLKKRISPFIRLEVLNPRYEVINVEAKVKFYQGKSETYYLELLKTDVKNFMAPWAMGDQSTISFGGKVFKSTILNFIESLDYVDYVTDFLVWPKNATNEKKSFEEIIPETARSILVSGDLKFESLNDVCCTSEEIRNKEMIGIGYYKIPEI